MRYQVRPGYFSGGAHQLQLPAPSTPLSYCVARATAVAVAVAIKLSHAAIVALGQTVDPMVVPEPVYIGFFSPGRT